MILLFSLYFFNYFKGLFMLQFKKTLLGGIAPVLLSIALASPVIASDAHHAHGKDHNFGHFTKDNLLLTPKDYREWIFVGAPVTPKI